MKNLFSEFVVHSLKNSESEGRKPLMAGYIHSMAVVLFSEDANCRFRWHPIFPYEIAMAVLLYRELGHAGLPQSQNVTGGLEDITFAELQFAMLNFLNTMKSRLLLDTDLEYCLSTRPLNVKEVLTPEEYACHNWPVCTFKVFYTADKPDEIVAIQRCHRYDTCTGFYFLAVLPPNSTVQTIKDIGAFDTRSSNGRLFWHKIKYCFYSEEKIATYVHQYYKETFLKTTAKPKKNFAPGLLKSIAETYNIKPSSNVYFKYVYAPIGPLDAGEYPFIVYGRANNDLKGFIGRKKADAEIDANVFHLLNMDFNKLDILSVSGELLTSILSGRDLDLFDPALGLSTIIASGTIEEVMAYAKQIYGSTKEPIQGGIPGGVPHKDEPKPYKNEKGIKHTLVYQKKGVWQSKEDPEVHVILDTESGSFTATVLANSGKTFGLVFPGFSSLAKSNEFINNPNDYEDGFMHWTNPNTDHLKNRLGEEDQK